MFVGDAEVGKPPGDFIVACAHRGPSFASQTTLVAGDVLYLLLVLKTGSCSPGPSVAGTAVPVTVFIDSPTWKLASDFRTAPDQANPNPDSDGLGVWAFEHGSALHDPTSYTPLDDFIPNAFGIDGLEQWQGSFESSSPLDRLPAVGINATGSDQHPLNIDWPANTIRVHPLAGEAVIVRWRSPLTGHVRVDAQFSDLDSSCGDGIGWYIDNGTTTQASGQIANGGAPQKVTLGFHVSTGKTIYFIVDDGGAGNYFCDSTGLTITIHT